MGCVQSTVDTEAKEANDRINRQLKEDKTKERKEIKLLLLGTGESGKSTVLKQMRIIHGGGYNETDRTTSRDVIFSNVVQSMKIILEANVKFQIPLGDPSNQVHFDELLNLRFQVETDVFPSKIAAQIKALWADSGIQQVFNRSREYQLNDSAKYYFDCIDRIAQPGFIPSDEDILHTRVKTTGIVESTFLIDSNAYRIFDVGGQRSERRKWIHCFEAVTAIIFVVALSEYDQLLAEDGTTNRIHEALRLFFSISHNRWFINTSVVLFLNKRDLFKKKVYISPIQNYFDAFVPDSSRALETQGEEFFKALFEEQYYTTGTPTEGSQPKINGSNNAMANRGDGAANNDMSGSGQGPKKNREVFTFETCATDTSAMKKIIHSVNQIILNKNLEACGLI